MAFWRKSAKSTGKPMPPDLLGNALGAKKAATTTKFPERQTDTGLGDALGGPAQAQAPAPEAKQAPEPIVEPAKTARGSAAYEDAEGTIHALPGSKTAKETPKSELDMRAWRATGRSAPIHTKVRPEYRKMFYQGAAREEKELCVVLEEMILARYGRKK